MPRFSIRELLLLTVVVALGLGWWLHARQYASDVANLKQQVAQQQQIADMQALMRAQEAQLLHMQLRAREIQQRLIMPPGDAPVKFNPGLPDSKLGR